MSKKYVSLKELFDNGIQYLEYGGKIICTDEGGLCYYDLYKDDDIEYGLLLCDGEAVEFGEWQDNAKFIIGTSEYGKQIYLSKAEYDIAVFEEYMEWTILHEYDGENGNPLFYQAKCVDCTVNVFYADDEFQVEIEDAKGIVEVSRLADMHFVTIEEAKAWIEKELEEAK